jgi:hypothetical protein
MKLKRWQICRTEGARGKPCAITFYGPWRNGLIGTFTIYSDEAPGRDEFMQWLLRKLNAKPKRRT